MAVGSSGSGSGSADRDGPGRSESAAESASSTNPAGAAASGGSAGDSGSTKGDASDGSAGDSTKSDASGGAAEGSAKGDAPGGAAEDSGSAKGAASVGAAESSGLGGSRGAVGSAEGEGPAGAGRSVGWRDGLLGRLAVRCLQLIIFVLAVWIVGQVLGRITFVAVSLAIAVLLAALFVPGVRFLTARKVPRALATAITLLGGLALVGGLVAFMVGSVVAGLPDLGSRLSESYGQLQGWLGRLGVSGQQIDRMLNDAANWVSQNRSNLMSGVWGVVSTAGTLLAGLVLAIFLLIFFVHDGERLWRGLLRPFAPGTRERVASAGERAFRDLTSYVRTTMVVAFIDAVGIGLGLWITGVPLVLPLAGLVFIGAFVPLIGAFVSGLVAVLVAFVTQGPVVALVIVGVVVLVQQLEGNLLEPLLMSHSVRLHPVAVILGVSIGAELAGVVGALLAVPIMTTVRSATAPSLPPE